MQGRDCNVILDKSKPAAKRGRKTTGLLSSEEIAGLPKGAR